MSAEDMAYVEEDIITLAETTPVYEALRLEEDLQRAGIATNWWVINASLYRTGTTNRLLAAKATVRKLNGLTKSTSMPKAILPLSPGALPT